MNFFIYGVFCALLTFSHQFDAVFFHMKQKTLKSWPGFLIKNIKFKALDGFLFKL